VSTKFTWHTADTCSSMLYAKEIDVVNEKLEK
jgi:hypothetical protein